MNKKIYSSAIKKTPYEYYVAKIIASLILEKFDRNEVFEKCFNKNYIHIDSLDRRREITNVIYSRLLCLDETLLKYFYDGDINTSKFLLVYATAKDDSLFFDFMFEVYREAILGNKDYIALDDFDNFFMSKKEVDKIVHSWAPRTIVQLARGYRNILVESGFGKRIKKSIYVTRPMIHPYVEEHIKVINDSNYLKALLGVE